jgi:hypothetical protein
MVGPCRSWQSLLAVVHRRVNRVYRTTATIAGAAAQGGGSQEFYWTTFGGTQQDFIDAHVGWWNALKAYVASGTTISVQGEIEELDHTNGELIGITAATGATISCTGSGGMLPPHVQGLVRWRTGVYHDGREIRGRTFIPGQCVSLASGGAPVIGMITPVNAACAALITSPAQLVIWRRERQLRPAQGTPGLPGYLPELPHRFGQFQEVLTGTMWDKFAILRSRRD